MKIKQKIEDILKKACEAVGVSVDEIQLEHPDTLEHGDYASNVALSAASEHEKNPRELAEAIVERVSVDNMQEIQNVTVAGPGFINVHLAEAWFVDAISHINKADEDFGANDDLAGQKILIEYTDPNPLKEFHVGHLMSNAVGESLARILEYSGAAVRRANYQGDVGMHVAKAVWGMHANDEMDKDSVADWGQAYAAGAQAYENQDDAAEDIKAINKAIYEENDTDVIQLYSHGREVSLKYFEDLYDTLGTDFDYYFYESETGQEGKEIVTEHTPGVFEESDGAIVFKGEDRSDELHTRVFINKEGLPTYEAKEIGLAFQKRDACPVRDTPWEDVSETEKYDFDTSLVVTGNEVNEYFNVVFAALKEIDEGLAEKNEHVGHGMLKLPDGAMSSRTGDVVAAADLIDEVKDAVIPRLKRIDENVEDEAAETIAVAALKYTILRNGIGKDITFQKEQALSFEGDSGPYLLYTYVRTQSVLKKARTEGLEADAEGFDGDVGDLERLLYRFEEIVRQARTNRAPQLITTYLTEIASAFNAFYAKQPIIDAEDSEYYLALTEAVGHVLKNGLHLLGIDVVERM